MPNVYELDSGQNTPLEYWKFNNQACVPINQINMSEQIHWRTLQNPDYLGSWDLYTDGVYKPIVATITGYDIKSVHNGKAAKDTLTLKLQGLKPFIINPTNGKAIQAALGTPDVKKWIGQQITIEVKKVNSPNGQVDALRVNPKRPAPAQQNVKETLTTSHPKWAAVVGSIKSNKYTIEQIKQFYNVSPDILTQLSNEAKN